MASGPEEKSPGLAALLGLLFGAFGLMYVSFAQGLIALALLIVLGGLSGGLLAPVIWLGCAVWGYVAAVSYNGARRSFHSQNAEQQNMHRGQHPAYPMNQGLPAAMPSYSPSANGTATAAFCGNCGAGLRAGVNFCSVCGGKAS